MRVDPERVEPRLLGQFPQDQEGACPGQRAAACIQEELGAVPGIEKRAPASEVAAQRFGCVPADRDDALLAALSDRRGRVGRRGRPPPARARPPRRLGDLRRRAVRRAPGHGASAAACRRRPGSSALLRRAKASSAAASCGAATQLRQRGCRCAHRGAVGGGRSCGSKRCGARSSSRRARPRATARRSARAPRVLPPRPVCRGRRPGRSGRGGRHRRFAASVARRAERGSLRGRDRDPSAPVSPGAARPLSDAASGTPRSAARRRLNRGQTPDVSPADALDWDGQAESSARLTASKPASRARWARLSGHGWGQTRGRALVRPVAQCGQERGCEWS